MKQAHEDASFDTIWGALGRRTRRRLLLALLTEQSPTAAELDPLAVLGDPDTSPETEIELVHNHLPKLESMGLIEWDRVTNTVSTGPEWDRIAPLLSVLDLHQKELPDGFR